MAVKFAISNGNWSSGGTWNYGTVPESEDVVYPNGYTVTIDTDISVASLNNSASPVYLPDMFIPAMTSNNYLGYTAYANANSSSAYLAFDQNNGTYWSAGASSGSITIKFPTPKVIKRYYLVAANGVQLWTFQASNDNFVNQTVILDTNGTSNSAITGLTNNTGFTYYRLSVTSVAYSNTLLLNSFEMTESIATTYGGNNGGYFNVPNTLVGTRNINLNGAGIINNASVNTVIINATSGNTVNFTKNVGNGVYIIGPAMVGGASTTASGIRVAGTATVNYIGDLYGDNSGAGGWFSTGGDINIAAATTFNLYGNIFTPRGNASSAHYVLYSSVNGATINIIGSVYGTTTNATICHGVYNGTNSTVNIVGNVVGNLGYAVNNASTGALNIQGVVQSTSLSTLAAITSTSTGLVTLSGPLINTNNTMAVYASRLRFYSGTTQQWRFQDTANATRVLYQSGYTGTTIGLPIPTDVRNGTVYGQYNEFVGTLKVPLPSDVRVNVLTDNTVGTGELTAIDFLNAITASTHPIAVRLKNIATTQTMGDQLAALSGRT